MKRYNLVIEKWWEEDLQFFEAEMRESRQGEFVKFEVVEKLKKKMQRMQSRIDRLEGRA